jgi:tRNA threonylcarbamoyl adenosine modification protein (Sua5/YciO/YrdC/YwlC family)
VSYLFDCSDDYGRSRGLARAAGAVEDGQLVVVPTESAYGVGCDAFSRSAVAAIHAVKARADGRPARRSPPPVLVPHGRTLDGLATGVPDAARALAEAFWPGQLTLLCRAQPTLDWNLGDSGGTVQVRMPLHPVALELLERTGPLALTGANGPGGAVPTTCDDAREQLGDAVEVYLDAGPSPRSGVSTVVDARSDELRLVRPGALTVELLLEVAPDLVVPAEVTG